MKQPKLKKCRVCKSLFTPYSSTQVVCDIKCSIALNKQRNDKKGNKLDKELRRQNRAAKLKLKTRSEHLADCQVIFNRYIRLRDSLSNCISCGKPAKKRNAGHFRSRKAAPELRFCEDNCHLQCEHCNTYKSGNIGDYRINLIKKIGLERVEWLESKHPPKHYNITEIQAIKNLYKLKCKELESKA